MIPEWVATAVGKLWLENVALRQALSQKEPSQDPQEEPQEQPESP